MKHFDFEPSVISNSEMNRFFWEFNMVIIWPLSHLAQISNLTRIPSSYLQDNVGPPWSLQSPFAVCQWVVLSGVSSALNDVAAGLKVELTLLRAAQLKWERKKILLASMNTVYRLNFKDFSSELLNKAFNGSDSSTLMTHFPRTHLVWRISAVVLSVADELLVDAATVGAVVGARGAGVDSEGNITLFSITS